MGFIDELQTYLQGKYPRTDARWQSLWQVSSNNTLAADWLLVNPPHAWGVDATNWKHSVAGTYPDFDLAECSPVTSYDAAGTKLCATVHSTVKAVGGKPANLSVSPGFEFYERVYDAMVSATKLIDITTLFTPTGEFLAAIRNAITYLSTKPEAQRPKIRFLYSTMGHPRTADLGLANRAQGFRWWAPVDPWMTSTTVIKDLIRDVKDDAKMEIYVAVVSSTVTGWNHSKIVAVDGTRAIAGGQNLWADDYLGPKPVFDVSMELSGPAAQHAHDYADLLWYWTPWLETERPNPITGETMPRFFHIRDQNLVSYKFDTRSGKNKLTPGDLPARDFYGEVKKTFAPPSGGTARVMAIGRQAQMRWPELWIPTITGFEHDLYYRWKPADEPADDAIMKLFDLATSSIYLSLQNITGGGIAIASKRRPYLEKLADAVARGVTVTMIVSMDPSAGSGYGGDTPSNVNTLMLGLLTDATRRKTTTEAKALLQRNFRCANIAYNSAKTYPDGSPVANHAKTFIVDEKVFYVGSHNLYPSNLNEFGFIVEDATAAAAYVANYWSPLLEYSKTSGPLEYTNTDVDSKKAEAMAFVVALGRDKRLSARWQATVAHRKAGEPPASASAADKAAYQAETTGLLTVLINEAGFDTDASYVATASNLPFWTETGRAANDASDKFVKDIGTNKALLTGFVKVLTASYDTPEHADAAVTAWLNGKGYDCTGAQVNASLIKVRDQGLQFWTGFYDQAGFVLMDGGAYFNTSQPVTARSLAAAGDDEDDDTAETWDPSYPAPSKAPSLSVYTNTTTGSGNPLPAAALGDMVIINPTFANGVLSWEIGTGFQRNTTSGSLTFSEITRATLGDGFVGRECYGTITYPDDGTPPCKGTVSYYNREVAKTPPDTPPSVPPDDVHDKSKYLWFILGGALLAAAGAVAAYLKFGRGSRGLTEYEKYKKDLIDQNPDEVEMEPLVTSESSVNLQLTEELDTGLRTSEQVTEARERAEQEASDYEEDQASEQSETDENLGGEDFVEPVEW